MNGLVWGTTAALALLVTVVVWAARPPRTPDAVEGPLPEPPRTMGPGAPSDDAGRPSEIDYAVEVEVRTPDQYTVFSGDSFTFRAAVKTRRRYGWCYQIDDRKAQLLFALKMGEDNRLVGRRSLTFDSPDQVVYEFFVVVLADEDHPLFGSSGAGEWLTPKDIADLQAWKVTGRDPEAARRILSNALSRLKLKRNPESTVTCYQHRPAH